MPITVLINFPQKFLRSIQLITHIIVIFLTLVIHDAKAAYDDFDDACNLLLKDVEIIHNTHPDFPGFLPIKGNKQVIYNNAGNPITIELLGKSEAGTPGVNLVRYNGEIMILKYSREHYPSHRKDLMKKGYLPYDYTPKKPRRNYILLERGHPVHKEFHPSTPGSMDLVIQAFDLCKKYRAKSDMKPDNMITLERNKKKIIALIDFEGDRGNYFYDCANMIQGVARTVIEFRFSYLIENLIEAFELAFEKYSNINEHTQLNSNFDYQFSATNLKNLVNHLEALLPYHTLVYGKPKNDDQITVPSQTLFWSIIGKILRYIFDYENIKDNDPLKKIVEMNHKIPLYNSIWESKKVQKKRYLSSLEALFTMAKGGPLTPFDRYLLSLGSEKKTNKSIDQVILKLIKLKDQKQENKEEIALLPSSSINTSLIVEYELFNMEEWQEFKKLMEENAQCSEWYSFLKKIRKRVLSEFCKITNTCSGFFQGMLPLYNQLVMKVSKVTKLKKLNLLSLEGLEPPDIDLYKEYHNLKDSQTIFSDYYHLLASIEEVLGNDHDLKEEYKKLLATNIAIRFYQKVNLSENNPYRLRCSYNVNLKEAAPHFLNYLKKNKKEHSELLINFFEDFSKNWKKKEKEKKEVYSKLKDLLSRLEQKLFKHKFNYNSKFEDTLSELHKAYDTTLKQINSSEMAKDLSEIIKLYQSSFLSRFQIIIVNAVKQYISFPNEYYNHKTLTRIIETYSSFLATQMDGQYKLPTDILKTLSSTEWPVCVVHEAPSELKADIQVYLKKIKSFARKNQGYLSPITCHRMYIKLYTPFERYINNQEILELIEKELGQDTPLGQYFPEWKEEQKAYTESLQPAEESQEEQTENQTLSDQDKKIIENVFPDYFTSEEPIQPSADDEPQSSDSSPLPNPNDNPPKPSPAPTKHDKNTANLDRVESQIDKNGIPFSKEKETDFYKAIKYFLVGSCIAGIIGLLVKYWPWKKPSPTPSPNNKQIVKWLKRK